jgi:DNA-directed RNA polymerase subunit RPC12/RpoP
MMLLKACPKCGGDITFDSDIYGRYTRCLQCGLMRDVLEKQDDARVPVKPLRETEVEAA